MTDAASSLASLWRSLPHSLTHDTRDPAYSVELPNGQVWDLYVTSILAWSELLLLIAVEAFLAALLSILLFKFAVRNQGTLLSYVICYLVVVPLVLAGPFQLFKHFQIRNQIFRFCLGAVMPITCLFKTTAVAHGFTPDYAKISTTAFAYFYACPMLMERQKDKFVPITSSDIIGNLKGFAIMLVVNGSLLTFFQCIPDIVPPFGQGPLPSDSDWYSWSMLFDPKRWLVRNILFGITFQVLLSLFGEGLMLAQGLLSGYRPRGLMDNPIMTSRSISQFWGSKWNLVIHDVLKIGVYLPLRRHVPRQIAMLGTFAASGLFHEALLWIFSYPLDDTDGCFSDPEAAARKAECYSPSLFTTTAFFLWQAFWIGLEFSPLGHLAIWDKMPNAVATFLVLAVGGFLGHYFAEPYWNSLGFDNAMILLTLFKPAEG